MRFQPLTVFVGMALAVMLVPWSAEAQLHFSDEPTQAAPDPEKDAALRTAQIRDQHRAERQAQRQAERAARAEGAAPRLPGRAEMPQSMKERIEENRNRKFEERRRYREEQRAQRAEQQRAAKERKAENQRQKEEKARQLEEQRKELAFEAWQKKLKVEHTPKKPSATFLKRFEPYVLSLGSVSLMRDTVASVQAKSKSCTLIPNESSEDLGRIVCTDTRFFGADGEAVLFGYLKENDVIVTADFFFRQHQKLENRTKSLLSQAPFKEHFRTPVDEVRYESPMYTLTEVENPVPSIGTGSWLRIQTRYIPELGPLDRAYAAGGNLLEFGTLSVGQTERQDIQDYSFDCSKISADRITNFSEYYGKCFGFSEEAFYQLAWDPETQILSQLTVTPIRVAIANILDDTLRAKYGTEKFCLSLDTNAHIFNRTNRKNFKAATMYSREDFRKMPANVYLGTCDAPYVFTTSMRYVFRTVVLGEDRIAADYKERLHENEIQSSIVAWRKEQYDKFKEVLTPIRDDDEPTPVKLPDNIRTYQPKFEGTAQQAAKSPVTQPPGKNTQSVTQPPEKRTAPRTYQPRLAPVNKTPSQNVKPAEAPKAVTAPQPAPAPVKAVRPTEPVMPAAVRRVAPPKVIQREAPKPTSGDGDNQ